MLEWVKAKYNESQMQDRHIMTSLEWVANVGKYHIFSCDNGEKVVTFSDQDDLLAMIIENMGSIFLIDLLLPSNNKFKYEVTINGEQETVYTIARACVLIPGTPDNPVNLKYRHTDGLIIVE